MDSVTQDVLLTSAHPVWLIQQLPDVTHTHTNTHTITDSDGSRKLLQKTFKDTRLKTKVWNLRRRKHQCRSWPLNWFLWYSAGVSLHRLLLPPTALVWRRKERGKNPGREKSFDWYCRCYSSCISKKPFHFKQCRRLAAQHVWRNAAWNNTFLCCGGKFLCCRREEYFYFWKVCTLLPQTSN